MACDDFRNRARHLHDVHQRSLRQFGPPNALAAGPSRASWTLAATLAPARSIVPDALRGVVDGPWYRSLFQRVGENSLWFSRLRMNDDELRDIINDSRCDIYVFEAQGQEEGLVELFFDTEGECELSFFGLTPPMIGQGAGRWVMNRVLELAWSPPYPPVPVTHGHPRSPQRAGLLHPVRVRAVPQAGRGCRRPQGDWLAAKDRGASRAVALSLARL